MVLDSPVLGSRTDFERLMKQKIEVATLGKLCETWGSSRAAWGSGTMWRPDREGPCAI